MSLLTYVQMIYVQTPQVVAYTPSPGFRLINLEPGVDTLTLEDIVQNIITSLISTIFYVSTAIFVYGAFLYVLSAFKEDQKNNGKEFMIGALIGLGIVLSAKVILNIVLAFIYS